MVPTTAGTLAAWHAERDARLAGGTDAQRERADAFKATSYAMWRAFDYASPHAPEAAATRFLDALRGLGFEVTRLGSDLANGPRSGDNDPNH